MMGEEEERRRSGRGVDPVDLELVPVEGVVDSEKVGLALSTIGFSGKAFFFSLSSSKLLAPSLNETKTEKIESASLFRRAHTFSFLPSLSPPSSFISFVGTHSSTFFLSFSPYLSSKALALAAMSSLADSSGL